MSISSPCNPGWIGALALALLTACGPENGPGTTPAVPHPAPPHVANLSLWNPDGKVWLAHYMPWYVTPEVRGKWGNHWAGHDRQHNPDTRDENGLPDIFSHYHPLIGLYDSTDRDVIECQLLQMKLAGVNGVIADWYGISDTANYPEIHEATRVLFDMAGRLGMSFSVCYEDRTIDLMIKRERLTEAEIAGHLLETMHWMEKNWFKAAHYEKVGDRPLLLNFGPMRVREPAVWEQALSSVSPRPYFFALHHLWNLASADGGFSWVHQHAWKETGEEDILNRLTETYARIAPTPEQVLPSAYPGFHDTYAQSFGTLPHRNGATLRESLEVCMEGPWERVQLITWNDYGEGTILEPTHEFGYLFLEILQEARRKESSDFPFTADDLRLPARLLALRKSPNPAAEDLDDVARMLAGGRVDAARERLAGLEGATP